MKGLLRGRSVVALIGGLMVFSIVYAAAASLSVSSQNLSTGSATVASCDTDGVTTSYAVSYYATGGYYQVDTVTVGGIADACLNRDFSVTLAQSDNTLLATVSQADVAAWTTTSPDANTLDFNFSASHVNAASVGKIFVSISD